MATPIINQAANGLAPWSPGGYQPSMGMSFRLDFQSEGVFDTVYTTPDAIKEEIRNWFNTNKGSRPLNPSFGSLLQTYLFENINNNTLEVIEMNIRDEIETIWGGGAATVIVQDVSVLGNPDYNEIKIVITYYVEGQLAQTNVNFYNFGSSANMDEAAIQGLDSPIGDFKSFVGPEFHHDPNTNQTYIIDDLGNWIYVNDLNEQQYQALIKNKPTFTGGDEFGNFSTVTY